MAVVPGSRPLIPAFFGGLSPGVGFNSSERPQQVPRRPKPLLRPLGQHRANRSFEQRRNRKMMSGDLRFRSH